MSPYAVDAIQVVAVLFLVGLNAFFVAAEFALVTIRWTRVQELVDQNRFGAPAVRAAVERLDRAIASTQLGITFASLALGWLGEPALAHLLQPIFRAIPGGWSVAVTHGAAVALAFLAITYLHVVLGELVPKAIALERAEQVALLVAGPLLMFGRLFHPFIRVIGRSGRTVVGLLRLPAPPIQQQVHSVDELSMLVEETQEAGVIPEDQATYVQNVFELSDKRVRDIMVPRERVVTLSLHASEDEILETARDTAHTRMPVWEGTPDNTVGVVNTKDLFHLFSLRGLVNLMDAMYPPLFVEPGLQVSQLLRTFRRERRPLAVVRDKDGTFLGIVTLEDILEEIVGEIEDEHDVNMPHGLVGRAAPAASAPPVATSAPATPATPATQAALPAVQLPAPPADTSR
ncbi:MAG: HlyC/CorC family transporter [Candidatus Eisenbacteria bacterium]|uniref:HlyC/CorC family transporter n=1 Tax=Eiseniibacteriota bacterium TaxID=2212470 RepID=A0A9D6LBX8_UNCEI|nr:HlyC/CorC family transporter [Candidatus Eisenbacteria bacterium]MBI3539879.1 HlyC/CorC family transporter [Candidatus Eisenbacteria bacterium]